MSDTLIPEEKSAATNLVREATSTAATTSQSPSVGQQPRTHRVMVKTQAGVAHTVAGSAGISLMEVIRNAGIDELPAYCGGNCSCGTCHVHVAPDWHSRLAPMADDEDAVLQGTPSRNMYSRLSCQIPFSEQLDGLEVVIAEME